jgi:hypothetical protein
MLRKSISVFLASSLTLKIDQRRQQPRQGFAQQAVESRPQKRLLRPPLEMQQAFERFGAGA